MTRFSARPSGGSAGVLETGMVEDGVTATFRMPVADPEAGSAAGQPKKTSASAYSSG